MYYVPHIISFSHDLPPATGTLYGLHVLLQVLLGRKWQNEDESPALNAYDPHLTNVEGF